MKVSKDFRIEPHPPFRVARLDGGDGVVHLVASEGSGDWLSFAARIAALANPASLRISAPGAYASLLALWEENGPAFHVLETFAEPAAARRAARRIAAVGRALRGGETPVAKALRPATLPLDFFGRRVSVVLAAGPDGPDGQQYRRLVEDVVRARMPAHLRPVCYWLGDEEVEEFESDHGLWRGRLAQCHSASSSTDSDRALCDAAAAVLRRRIDALHARDLAQLRAKTRYEALA